MPYPKNAHFGLLLALFIGCLGNSWAQTLNAPTPADNPNLPGNSPWSAACASASFNEYFMDFSWSTPLVNSNNEFILELSDATGDFSSATELAKVSDDNLDLAVSFSFAVPNTVRGSGYKFRVRSTSPAITGPETAAFNVYFMDFTSSILISEDASGVIPPGGELQICDGNAVTIGAHNVPNADTYTYRWTRSGTVLAETGPSITVSQTGMYMVEIDYGPVCSGSANTLSNSITVTNGSTIGIAINPPANTALCSGETQVLEANVSGQGLSYTWKKDGTTVAGPTVDAHTYTVDASNTGFAGDYTVEISGAGACREESAAVTITNTGDFDISLNQGTQLSLLPGDSVNLGVTTTAASPTYQWYRNNIIITGATNANFDATQAGDYFVRVGTSGGACASATKDSEVMTVSLPASFDITIAYNGNFTNCVSSDATLEISLIEAVDGSGTPSDVTSQMQSQFSYQWQKDGVNVAGATNATHTVSDAADNGDYRVVATLDSFTPQSNTLGVALGSGQTLTITATSTVLCEGGDAITLSTDTALGGKTFGWFRDGTQVDASSPNYSPTEPGTYTLRITEDSCTVDSNEVVITNFDDSQVTLDSDTNVVILEGSSQTVTASGADSYAWFNSANEQISNGPSVTLSLEGDYRMVATSGSCTVTRNLTVSFRDTFGIPNVITANGDGLNDQWILPNSYANDPDVTVIIYNHLGDEVLNQNDYQNDWPSSSTAFPKQNMVFYYTIKNTTETLKKGTITVIR
ncbi:T9SS type B sorting domain-containing protein [Sediminicola luteus]|uniref:Ig-like domain-containing protein n=1 Tax=Sediminicola luteus TaxID=319238 RepID=A0A2A4GEF0_9FLAO|nr:gliding motility-associated C-terminal domain-containing protein [Sediminicola luteus]PCE66791.1 hypothetical protein B7P33_04655 [Sediminicola luteus]